MSSKNNLRRKTCLIIVADVNMTSKRAYLQNSNSVTKFNDRKKGFYLNKIIVFGVLSVTTITMNNALCKTQIETIDVQVAPAFLSKSSLT